MRLLIFFITFFFIVFLTACATQQKRVPKVMPKVVQEKKLEVKKKKASEYKLSIVTQKGARIRILNIKPKYYDGIVLKPGNYLIEVSKPGYLQKKKWIKLEDDLQMEMYLKKIQNPFDTSYFHYVKKVSWYNTDELFVPVYDKKNNLVWAFPKEYLWFVSNKHPKKPLKNTLLVEGLPWPKIVSAKLQTPIYTGYYRYKGRNFLFKNKNSFSICQGSKEIECKKNVASLKGLLLNGRQLEWRLPKETEILKNNPFKKYQKYFEISYKRNKKFKMNIPLLYTRLKKNRFYSNGALAYQYNNKTKLYDGLVLHSTNEETEAENIHFALNHAKNFALLLPVRKKKGFYDSIIFHPNLDAFEKFKALSSALIKKRVKSTGVKASSIAQEMATKAMKMLFGDPLVKGNILYSANRERVYISQKRLPHRKHIKRFLFRVRQDGLVLERVE